jgi:tripartite-type tricarboxylate transporter receptor subunit TctC
MSVTRRPLLALPALLLAKPALAAWPDRPLRLIVPFPPGSGTDILARLLAEPLGRQLGQPVVVDNRPGGNGIIGAQAGATAPADGYHLLMVGTSVAAINPHTVRRLPYDPLRDFAPIGGITHQPYLLAIHPDRPERDLKSFLEAGRRAPNGLTFGTGNAGSLIMAQMIGRAAGIRMTAVPYRGGPEALNDVSTGRLDFNLADFGVGLSQQRGGRIRLIAVTTAERFPLAPELPPIASELPGFDANVWFTLVAPAGVPAEIITRANGALNAVLADSDMATRLHGLGMAPMPLGPDALRRHFERELAIWGERVRAAGIEPQ